MDFEAVIVGSGPNGLAAAIELARAGCRVAVFESRDTVGGGARSAELTLPGFVHDVCSAVHPLALASPFFKTLPLRDHGLEWIQPEVPLAHPFDDGTAVLLQRSLPSSERIGYFAEQSDALMPEVLAPAHFPRQPLLFGKFAMHALQSARSFALRNFPDHRARALFGGIAAHSAMPLENRPTAGFGIVLHMLGHAVGWPIPRGGSQNIANALRAYLETLGGKVFTGRGIKTLSELPPAKAILCDVTPRQLLHMVNDTQRDQFGESWQRYRYGPGVFKMDWALSGPIPWKSPECGRAATIHIGGSFDDIAASEAAVNDGRMTGNPFIILVQPSLFDPTRAPEGRHTAWAYCHVPNGSKTDMSALIEARIERVAPGFRDCILARHCMNTEQMETYNPNYIGGDINGGAADIRQFLRRPVSFVNPYRTPLKGVYLCSSSTPPGGAVHGMCGFHAARAVLEDLHIRAYNPNTY